MRDVVVLGVGMVRFQRYPDRHFADFGREAVRAAVADAGIDLRDLQAGFCGARQDVGMGPGARVMKATGKVDMPIITVEAASASGGASFHEAWVHVAGGFADVALAMGIGVGGKPIGHLGGATASDQLRQRAIGVLPAAGAAAMRVQRRELETGHTLEACTQVCVKAHKNAAHNPYAHRNRAVTAEQVRNARMIAEPLTTYHCCPASEGAAAAVLATREWAERHTTGPRIQVAGGNFSCEAGTDHPAMVTVANRAYHNAGLGPEDIDVVQGDDSFSMTEIELYEELGFAAHGEGEKLILEGATEIGGRIPFNTDGGKLARGHAIGPTGLAALWETVNQLRGTAGVRQVEGARIGMICQGGASGEAMTHIFKRI